MQLFMISTSLRTAFLWVAGHERAASVAYFRAQGETVYAIQRVEA